MRGSKKARRIVTARGADGAIDYDAPCTRVAEIEAMLPRVTKAVARMRAAGQCAPVYLYVRAHGGVFALTLPLEDLAADLDQMIRSFSEDERVIAAELRTWGSVLERARQAARAGGYSIVIGVEDEMKDWQFLPCVRGGEA